MFIIKNNILSKKKSLKEHIFKISYAEPRRWIWSLSVSLGQPGPSRVLRLALHSSQQKGSRDRYGTKVKGTVLAQRHPPWAVAIPEVQESAVAYLRQGPGACVPGLLSTTSARLQLLKEEHHVHVSFHMPRFLMDYRHIPF